MATLTLIAVGLAPLALTAGYVYLVGSCVTFNEDHA